MTHCSKAIEISQSHLSNLYTNFFHIRWTAFNIAIGQRPWSWCNWCQWYWYWSRPHSFKIVVVHMYNDMYMHVCYTTRANTIYRYKIQNTKTNICNNTCWIFLVVWNEVQLDGVFEKQSRIQNQSSSLSLSNLTWLVLSPDFVLHVFPFLERCTFAANNIKQKVK